MGLRFTKLTRARLAKLTSGQRISEHGVVAERTAKGDVRYSINIMVDGERIHRVAGTETGKTTPEKALMQIEALRTHAREGRLERFPADLSRRGIPMGVLI